MSTAKFLSSTIVFALSFGTTFAQDAPSPTITARANLEARQGGSTPLPLTQYTYSYSNVPYKVNPYQYLRGPQSGYNQCNATTEGPNAMCQTAIINSLDDFCLWGAPGMNPNETIGDVEAAVVAYCSKSGHGARIFPPGTITGAQFMRTSAYVQIVGRIQQNGVGLTADDSGGELDPHGADLLGNPLGGLTYTTAFGGDNSTYRQVVQWNNFIGGGTFCYKLCFPNVTSPNYCENRYDLLGCAYNAPAAYTNNSFTSCDGDLQDVVGTYVQNGQTMTYSQPSSIPAGSTLPYTPRVPASSNCVTYSSAQLYPSSALGYQTTAFPTSTTVKPTTAQPTAGSSNRVGSSGAANPTTTASRTAGATDLVVKRGALLLVVGLAVTILL